MKGDLCDFRCHQMLIRDFKCYPDFSDFNGERIDFKR